MAMPSGMRQQPGPETASNASCHITNIAPALKYEQLQSETGPVEMADSKPSPACPQVNADVPTLAYSPAFCFHIYDLGVYSVKSARIVDLCLHAHAYTRSTNVSAHPSGSDAKRQAKARDCLPCKLPHRQRRICTQALRGIHV